MKEKQRMEENRPYLSDIQKNAYRELTELCVHNNSKKTKILKFIEGLKNYDKDEEYYTTLNYFMEFLDEGRFNFIMGMDFKAAIEDLKWLLENRIKDNYKLKIPLPEPDQYEKLASVSYDHVLEDFDRPLRENGLQLGFIDTQSDEYIAVLHQVQDREKVKQAVNKMGYDYYETKMAQPSN